MAEPRIEWRPDQEAVTDPSDPEVQAAATRIQAGYKGMQASINFLTWQMIKALS